MEEVNITKVCGCCLSINDLSLMSNEAIHLFAFCFSIQISNCSSSVDSSPFICNSCVKKIKDCYQFRCQILDSQTKLRELHSSTNIENTIKIEYDKDEKFKFTNPIKEEWFSDMDDAENTSSSLISHKVDDINMIGINTKHKNESIKFNTIENIELSLKPDPVKRKTEKENSKVDIKRKIKLNLKTNPVKKAKSLKRNWVKPEDRTLPFKLNKDDTVCKICGEKFTCHKILINHMAVHYPNFICDTCGKPFILKLYLQSHMKSHKTENVECTVCKKSVKSTYLWAHMKQHKNKKIHACPHCSERFVSYHHRVKHMEKVHKADVYIHHCKICLKKFHMAHMLTEHIRRSHFQEKNTTCVICGKRFFGTSNLNEHMTKHTGEKKFQCDICSKSYTRRQTLIFHMRSHGDNVKKYQCTLCNKDFTQNGSLTVHLKNIHKKKIAS